ncbi:MAG: hypothetical protein Aurels2KO_58390 [Aureliella sp.]
MLIQYLLNPGEVGHLHLDILGALRKETTALITFVKIAGAFTNPNIRAGNS